MLSQTAIQLLPLAWSVLGALFVFAAAGVLMLVYGRTIVKMAFGSFIRRILKDKYSENLAELYTAVLANPPRIIIETSLRAEDGKPLQRALGSPKNFPHLDNLMFGAAQLGKLPTPEHVKIDSSVTIGKSAKKPLTLEIPILISGMAFGLALSQKSKVAIARAAAILGTATNTGEGSLMPEERQAAKHLIIQFSRGGWTQSPEILGQADAIEIQAGQGADVSAAVTRPPQTLDRETRKLLGLQPGQEGIIKSRLPGVERPEDLCDLVDWCRRISGGVPIGFKIAGTHFIEHDLEAAIFAGADYIAVDGAQGGSHGAPAMLQDDFGIPTVIALSRAARFLENHGLKDRISLIVSGGLATPGEFLKCLALGADACYIGTAAVFAIAHASVSKALPWEPVTSLVWQEGKHRDQLDIPMAVQNLANYVKSCVAEMTLGVRALGKTGFRQVSREDLCALNREISEITGVQLAYEPVFETSSDQIAGQAAVPSAVPVPARTPVRPKPLEKSAEVSERPH